MSRWKRLFIRQLHVFTREIGFCESFLHVCRLNPKSSPAVQLADVMIGAAIEAANTLTGQRAGALNAREVMALYADHQLIHMLPSIDFEEQKRFRQGTQAARVIDYFAENFRKP